MTSNWALGGVLFAKRARYSSRCRRWCRVSSVTNVRSLHGNLPMGPSQVKARTSTSSWSAMMKGSTRWCTFQSSNMTPIRFCRPLRLSMALTEANSSPTLLVLPCSTSSSSLRKWRLSCVKSWYNLFLRSAVKGVCSKSAANKRQTDRRHWSGEASASASLLERCSRTALAPCLPSSAGEALAYCTSWTIATVGSCSLRMSLTARARVRMRDRSPAVFKRLSTMGADAKASYSSLAITVQASMPSDSFRHASTRGWYSV
ncbi:hypothetical protein V8C86DRAFT_2734291 [Haematococcus lacustris]